MKKKNDRGETAYDLAIKSGYEVLSRRLVASLGQSQLEKLLRGKQTPLEWGPTLAEARCVFKDLSVPYLKYFWWRSYFNNC